MRATALSTQGFQIIGSESTSRKLYVIKETVFGTSRSDIDGKRLPPEMVEKLVSDENSAVHIGYTEPGNSSVLEIARNFKLRPYSEGNDLLCDIYISMPMSEVFPRCDSQVVDDEKGSGISEFSIATLISLTLLAISPEWDIHYRSKIRPFLLSLAHEIKNINSDSEPAPLKLKVQASEGCELDLRIIAARDKNGSVEGFDDASIHTAVVEAIEYIDNKETDNVSEIVVKYSLRAGRPLVHSVILQNGEVLFMDSEYDNFA